MQQREGVAALFRDLVLLKEHHYYLTFIHVHHVLTTTENSIGLPRLVSCANNRIDHKEYTPLPTGVHSSHTHALAWRVTEHGLANNGRGGLAAVEESGSFGPYTSYTIIR